MRSQKREGEDVAIWSEADLEEVVEAYQKERLLRGHRRVSLGKAQRTAFLRFFEQCDYDKSTAVSRIADTFVLYEGKGVLPYPNQLYAESSKRYQDYRTLQRDRMRAEFLPLDGLIEKGVTDDQAYLRKLSEMLGLPVEGIVLSQLTALSPFWIAADKRIPRDLLSALNESDQKRITLARQILRAHHTLRSILVSVIETTYSG